MIRYLPPKFRNKRHQVGCQYFEAGKKRIERNSTKWRVEASNFKNMDVYPFGVCDGFFVVMTGDLVAPMLAAAKVTPFFWIDDVYLYGMLLYQIGGVRFVGFARFITWNMTYATDCARDEGTDCSVLVVLDNNYNRHRSDHIKNIWEQLICSLTEYDKTRIDINEKIFKRIRCIRED